MVFTLVGWIIENGFLESQQIHNLVSKLEKEGRNKGMDLKLINTRNIIYYYDNLGFPKLKVFGLESEGPDYVIFWDKDVSLARHLESMGIRVFNRSDGIALCDDKILMTCKLSSLGIPIPRTIVGPFSFDISIPEDDFLDEAFEILGDTIIIKEAFGSFGMQVYKAESRDELREKIEKIGNKRYLLQRYIESSEGRDIRINIIGDKIVGGMLRENKEDFRSNITIGGFGKKLKLTSKQEEIALKAHKALGLDFSGVDILFGRGEEPILCEVNSNVNFLGFEQFTGINYGRLLLEYIEEVL